MLDHLMQDTVSLLKKNGTETKGLKASVRGSKIVILPPVKNKLLIEPEDLIHRTMSNGAEETYRVIDPGFKEGLPGHIQAHYQMEVRKLGIQETKEAVQSIQSITYNIVGNNARINQNSIDNSANKVHINSTALQNIEMLRAEINQLHISEEERTEIVECIDAIEEQFKSGNPKKTIVSRLLKMLPDVATVTSSVASIMNCL